MRQGWVIGLMLIHLTSGIFPDPGEFWQYNYHNEGWGNPNRILEQDTPKIEQSKTPEGHDSKVSKGTKYSYSYGVDDSRTGDVKTAYETNEKGLTKGSYSVLQPDGILRTVTYEADPWNGFRATVYNKGWGLRQNSHGWGGFKYEYKDNRVYSEDTPVTFPEGHFSGPVTFAVAEIPCSSVLNQLIVFEGISLPLNFDVILLSHDVHLGPCLNDFRNVFTNQIGYHSLSIFGSSDWTSEFPQRIKEHTFFFSSCENFSQVEASITEFQRLYSGVVDSKRLWVPVFAIFMGVTLAQEIKPEMKEEWASLFGPDSQVYLMVWDTFCGNKSPVIVSAMEIYSVTNTRIVSDVSLDRTCESLNLEFFSQVVETRSKRRLNFHKALIVGVNVDDPDYKESTSYKKNNNGSEKIEFEGGFEVQEFWYLRDALNFTEKATKWPTYMRQAPNGSLTGLAVSINAGISDLCIGYTEFLEYRATAPNGVTFLHPTFFNEIQAFFTQPAASSIRDIFLNTFKKDIWLSVLATWLLIVFLLVFSLRVKLRADPNSVHPLDFRIYDEVWFWAVGAICQKGFYVSPFSVSIKMIFIIGITTGLIVFTAYSAALVSVLSVEVIPVRTFSDLLSNEFGIFSDSHIPTASDVVKSLETSGTIKKLDGVDGRNVDIGLTLTKLIKTDLAIVSFSDSFYQILLAKQFQPDFVCTKISKVLFRRRPALGSMFVKRGSPLRGYFNVKIALMKERGIMLRLRSHYILATSVQCLQHSGGFIQQLAVKDLFTAYIILAVGFISSVVIWIIERLKAFRFKTVDQKSSLKNYWKDFEKQNPEEERSFSKKTQLRF